MRSNGIGSYGSQAGFGWGGPAMTGWRRGEQTQFLPHAGGSLSTDGVGSYGSGSGYGFDHGAYRGTDPMWGVGSYGSWAGFGAYAPGQSYYAPGIGQAEEGQPPTPEAIPVAPPPMVVPGAEVLPDPGGLVPLPSTLEAEAALARPPTFFQWARANPTRVGIAVLGGFILGWMMRR